MPDSRTNSFIIRMLANRSEQEPQTSQQTPGFWTLSEVRLGVLLLSSCEAVDQASKENNH